MKSMIVAGNKNYGLAECIYKVYPNSKFYSRTSGNLDLTNKDDRKIFINDSLNYNVFISCSYLYEFNQLLLVKELWEKWFEENKKGTIIVLGSTSDNNIFNMYSIEKRSLKEYCVYVSRSFKSKIKITYLSPGLLDTNINNNSSKLKINLDYIVDTITWILEQPDNINIQNISILPK